MSLPLRAFDVYRVPRESVDVEALARRAFKYFRIAAEDAEILSLDPTSHNRITAELYANPAIKPDILDTSQFVKVGEDPENHLGPADAHIERLTPPQSLEDRVIRMHLAATAAMINNQYNLKYALHDHRDLWQDVKVRTNKLLTEWIKNELPLICPATRAGRTSRVTPSTPPHATYNGFASATPSHHSAHPSMRPLDQNEVEAFLKTTLVKKKFLHSPAQGVQSQGIWEIIGFTARFIDDEVDQELEVLFDEPDGPITMDLEDVRDLLETSKLFI